METDKPEIIQTGDGLNIYYKKTYFYPTFSPLKATEKKIELLKILPNTLVIVPSLGLGYGLDKLLAKLPENSHILCIEIDEQLFKLGISQNLPTYSPNISVIRTTDENILNELLEKIGIHNFRRVLSVPLNRGYSLYREKYNRLTNICRTIINNYWQNRITTIKMGGLWIRNILKNLQFFPSAYDLKDIYISSPIIIIGAGVSLEENVSFLQKNKDRAILITVDTALPVLGNLSITPDFIVTQDAQLTNLQDFIPSKPDLPSCVLADITTTSSIFRNINNTPVVFFKSDFEKLAIFNRMEEHGILPYSIPPLGSVGITALYLALKMTKSNFPIFTVGLDFSYKKNLSHARESTLYRILNLQCFKLKPIELLNFEHIITRPIIKSPNLISDSFTDLVLLNYKFQFNKLFETNRRIYILDQHYSWKDEIKKRIIDQKSAEKIISSYTYSKPRRNSLISSLNHPFSSKSIQEFLKNELKILEEDIYLITKYLNNTNTTKSTTDKFEFSKQLKSIDYAFFFFPDYHGTPLIQKSFLRRILMSAYYYREKIKNMIEIFFSN